MIINDAGIFLKWVGRRYAAKLNKLEEQGYKANEYARVRHFGLFGLRCYFEDTLTPPPKK